MRFLLPLTAFVLCLCSLPLSAEEPAELVELRKGWEAQRGEAQAKIDERYFAELEELKKNYVKAGNLEAARAVEAAIKGEEKEGEQPSPLTKLDQAREKSLLKALKPLDKQYWQELKKLRGDFQKQGSLAGIETTDAEIEKVLAAYKKPEAPKAKSKAEDKEKIAAKEEEEDDKPNPEMNAILEKAKEMDAEMQFNLAKRYFNGDGVEKDVKLTEKLLHIAAEQNHPDACDMLGWLYRHGHGTRQNSKKAAEWYHRAAELGHGGAQCALGELCRDGVGVRKDGEKAIEWFRKSSEQGFHVAMRLLGDLYRDGNGIRKDVETAVEWYEKASDRGNQNAQYALGRLYRDGDGVAKDKAKAAEWFQKAADQGHKEAKMDLELLK